MTRTPDTPPESTLPGLERLLLDAAARRSTRRLPGRRWTLGLGVGFVILAGGAATAATGLLPISGGQSSAGEFLIERLPAIAGVRDEETVCLQLRLEDGGPARGCGSAPTEDEPFGLLVVDSLPGSRQQVVYGLVSDKVRTVTLLRRSGSRDHATASKRAGLPGRFFSLVVAHRSRIKLIGTDAAGRQVAQIGSLRKAAKPARSQEEARARGDLAAFAPAIDMPASFSYRGGTIPRDEAARRGLHCTQDRDGMSCTDP